MSKRGIPKMCARFVQVVGNLNRSVHYAWPVNNTCLIEIISSSDIMQCVPASTASNCYLLAGILPVGSHPHNPFVTAPHITSHCDTGARILSYPRTRDTTPWLLARGGKHFQTRMVQTKVIIKAPTSDSFYVFQYNNLQTSHISQQ